MTEILFARKTEVDALNAAPVLVSASSLSLPNALVATSSASITVNTATPLQIVWERAALTGDVTASANSNATTIANSAVTNAKMADMAQSTIKGRAAGAGTGAPVDLTATQATAILNAFTGDSGSGGVKGLVPAPAAGDAAAAKFLKADGTWVAATSSIGATTDNAIARWNGTSGTSLQNSGVTINDSNTMTWPDEVSRKLTRLGLGGNYVSIFDYTPNGAEVADYTSYFNAAVTDAISRAIRTIYFPERNYSFLSAPDPMPRGMNIIGDGVNATVLVFKNYRGTGLWWKEDVAVGGSVRNLSALFQADQKTITGITQANPAVVTCTAHGFVNGDKIVIRNVGGMTQVNNLAFTVANKTDNTFELQGINSSAYGAYTTGGYAQLVGSSVLLLGGDSVPPGTVQAANFFFEDITVSGGLDAISDYPILVAGENYLFGGPGAGSGGVRNCSMHNVRVFNAATTSIELRHPRGWSISNVETNQGNGLVNSIAILGVSADYLAADIKLSNVKTTDLTFDFAAQCAGFVSVLGTAQTSGTCTDVRLFGYAAAWSNGSSVASNTFNGSINNFSSSVQTIVSGPSSGSGNRIVTSNGTSGRLIQESSIVVDASTSALSLAGGGNILITGVREKLTAARTYYVRTDGSDSNTGLVDSAGGAFLTIQKAIDTVAELDVDGQSITIQVRDGTYTGANTLKSFVGNSTALITGNTSTPANVVISTTSANCFTGNGVRGNWQVQGMTLQTTTGGNCFSLDNYTTVVSGTGIVFGACAGIHILSQTAARFTVGADYTISGGASNHILTQDLGTYICQTKTITLTGTPAFTAFVNSRRFGEIIATGITFSGSATGSRYSVSNVGIIHTNGGGATYFPGDAAGAGTNTATSPYGMYI